jgi:hypothetical protein
MQGIASSSAGNESPVTFQIRELNPAERKEIAIRTLGIFWGLSLVTLPLPPIHWLTVPGFFLFGIVQCLKKLREGSHFEPFQFPCPECKQEVTVPAQTVQEPLEVVCPHCRYGLKLRWSS